MRNPKWHEGEVKLALYLYLNKGVQWSMRMSDKTFEIVALSKMLNYLDFYKEKPEKFRSTGSVRMKLANFMALDERYKGNSLDNIGQMDKLVWNSYAKNPEKLHDECVEIIRTHLIKKDRDIEKFIEIVGLNNDLFEPNFIRYSKTLVNALTYYETLAEQNQENKYAEQVKVWCKETRKSLNWIDDIPEDKMEFQTLPLYKEHGGINMLPRKKREKVTCTNEHNEEKIGRLVRRTIRELIEQDKLTEEIISKLLDPKYSKATFGLKPPFLIQIDTRRPISEQVIDENGYTRYWTKPIIIHGVTYCVTKEWFKKETERYMHWLESVKAKPFYMINAIALKKILKFIQKMDSEKICFSKKELYEKFPNVNIEKVVKVLLDSDVLTGFQGSTKELVVDDYDTLFRMIDNPKKYSME